MEDTQAEVNNTHFEQLSPNRQIFDSYPEAVKSLSHFFENKRELIRLRIIYLKALNKYGIMWLFCFGIFKIFEERQKDECI